LDTVQALDVTIHQADEAANLFGVSPTQVAASLRDVGHLDQPGGSAHAAETALEALIGVAKTHRQACGLRRCPMCTAIRHAIAANLATLRAMRMDAIERSADPVGIV
jgi:hypothetical protein